MPSHLHEALLLLFRNRPALAPEGDLVLNSLPEAARRALQAMDAWKYEYQSEFARRFFGQGKAAGMAEGKAEGMAEGRVEIVLKQLTTRYGALSPAAQSRVRGVSAAEVDSIAERLLTAKTLEEALELTASDRPASDR